MIKEIWKDVVGYDGLYQVSNLGNVRSIDCFIEKKDRWGNITRYKKKGKQLRPIDNRKGYFYISLGRKKRAYIHIIVAKAFIPNPDNKEEVNHKDFNKANNNVDNLEWCSTKENIKHAINKYKTFCKGKKIKCLETGEVFNTSIEAYKKTGITDANIRMAISKKTPNKMAGGYHWTQI